MNEGDHNQRDNENEPTDFESPFASSSPSIHPPALLVFVFLPSDISPFLPCFSLSPCILCRLFTLLCIFFCVHLSPPIDIFSICCIFFLFVLYEKKKFFAILSDLFFLSFPLDTESKYSFSFHFSLLFFSSRDFEPA